MLLFFLFILALIGILQFAQNAFYVWSWGDDYLIKVIAKDMEAYNDFYQRKLSALASVAHISSSFVMSEVKTTTVIPL